MIVNFKKSTPYIVGLAVIILMPQVAHSKESNQGYRRQCLARLATYLGTTKVTPTQQRSIGKILNRAGAACTAKQACKSDCRELLKTCKKARPDCKKGCKSAPGKDKKKCFKACSALMKSFRDDCNQAKTSCKEKCKNLKKAGNCRTELRNALTQVEKVKGGDATDLNNARKACNGESPKDAKAKNKGGKEGKNGKKKITLMDVEKAVSKAKEVIESPCGQKVKSHAGSVLSGVKTARSACKALRNCKKKCRKAKNAAKRKTKGSKKACKTECKSLKKMKRRSCMKQCRASAKQSKRSKKGSKRKCMVSCRKTHKTEACVGARKKIVGSLFKAFGALAADDSCRGYLKEAHDALKKADAAEDKESAQKVQ